MSYSPQAPISNPGAGVPSPAPAPPSLLALPGLTPIQLYALNLYTQGFSESEVASAAGLPVEEVVQLLSLPEAQGVLSTLQTSRQLYVDSLDSHQDLAAADAHRFLRQVLTGLVPTGSLNPDGSPEMTPVGLTERLQAAKTLIDRSMHTAKAARQTISVRAYASDAVETVKKRFREAVKNGSFSIQGPQTLDVTNFRDFRVVPNDSFEPSSPNSPCRGENHDPALEEIGVGN